MDDELGKIRQSGEVFCLPIAEIEMDIRKGKIPFDAALCYVPWTQGQFVAIRNIDALVEARKSPFALFAEHMRQNRFAWCSILLVLLLLAFAVRQSHFQWSWQQDSWLRLAPMGWESTVLAGRWWTPWLSLVFHENAKHVLCNAVVIAYCGYSVERALGKSGFVLVVAAAVCGATWLVCLIGSGMVIGGSVLAFGLWGAQISIGFRLANCIPESIQGRYGWGNLVIFVPLFVLSLWSEKASHLAHIGAIIGGGMAGFFPVSAVFVEPLKRVKQTFMALAWSVILTSMTISIGFLWFYPSALRLLEVETQIDEPAMKLDIASRLSYREQNGLQMWYPLEPLDVALFIGELEQDQSASDVWKSHTQARVQVMPESIFTGWQQYSIHLSGSTYIIEWQRPRGKKSIRMGCVLDKTVPSWSAFCQHWLATAQIVESKRLQAARTYYQDFPDIAESGLHYAKVLQEYGEFGQADNLYQKIAEKPGVTGWEARWERFQMFLLDSHLGSLQDQHWMLQVYREHKSPSVKTTRSFMAWLVEHKACSTAHSLSSEATVKEQLSPTALRHLRRECELF